MAAINELVKVAQGIAKLETKEAKLAGQLLDVKAEIATEKARLRELTGE